MTALSVEYYQRVNVSCYFTTEMKAANLHYSKNTDNLCPLQLLSVHLYRLLPMESSLTLPTPHLTMILELWLLIPVTLGISWTSLSEDLR